MWGSRSPTTVFSVDAGGRGPGIACSLMRQGDVVHGAVIWYHPDLSCALVERVCGLTLGTLEAHKLDVFHSIRRTSHPPTLKR